jgi:23S rRNA (uracil1939-C5)-methyltransferase
MVVIQFFYEDKIAREALLNHIKVTFPNITSLQYIINKKANDTIYDQDVHCFHGNTYITEKIGGLKFRITPKAFFQTNPEQTQILYEQALKLASIQATDIVYDLYTGLGTIAQYIAKQCKKVIGIESIPEAIVAAKENAIRNKVTNAEFEVGDMRKVFTDDFVTKYGNPDVIIVDPPRDGMHNDVIKQLVKIKSPKILYISCNPQTQARDLSTLSEIYDVVISQAIDMFPHTQHVENIVFLKLRE